MRGDQQSPCRISAVLVASLLQRYKSIKLGKIQGLPNTLAYRRLKTVAFVVVSKHVLIEIDLRASVGD